MAYSIFDRSVSFDSKAILFLLPSASFLSRPAWMAYIGPRSPLKRDGPFCSCLEESSLPLPEGLAFPSGVLMSHSLTSFWSLLSCHLPRETFSTSPLKIGLLPLAATLWSLLFVTALIPMWHYVSVCVFASSLTLTLEWVLHGHRLSVLFTTVSIEPRSGI